MHPIPLHPNSSHRLFFLRFPLSKKRKGSSMGTRPVSRATVLAGAFVVALLAAGLGAAAGTTSVVVGTVKCLDCSPMDADAEDALKGLKVAVKCKSGADETYETKGLAQLDDTGAFRIPLAAELLRDNGELNRDCFAQLYTSSDTPCVGQAPPRIAPARLSQDGNTTTSSGATYLAAAADTVFSPVACACGKFKKKKKKHFRFGPPPPPKPEPDAPKPLTPTYGPPTPTPVPEPKPPAPPAAEPEPFFHKHPKMKKFMHKKKPCPPLVDDDTTKPAAGGQEKVPKKLN